MWDRNTPNEKLGKKSSVCLEAGTPEKSLLIITVSNSRPLALWTVPRMKSEAQTKKKAPSSPLYT